MVRASAYCPAGISSFFEFRDRKSDGTPFTNPLFAGARGGGFVIDEGVRTEVRARPSDHSSIIVRINGKIVKNSTSERVAKRVLARVAGAFSLEIDHFQRVPISAGYGTSAAAALSTCLAVARSVGIALTVNEAGREAHISEIESQTGLGTVGGILRGGLNITIKSGGPGVGIVDRIPIEPRWKIISSCVGPIQTRKILGSREIRRKVNAVASETLECILSDPTIENFMSSCKRFADSIGLLRKETRNLISVMESAGAIAATQNMVGDAVHGVVVEEEARHVLRVLRRRFPKAYSFIADIDFEGVRIL